MNPGLSDLQPYPFERRFKLPAGMLDAERHVLPVNGTREALFAIAQCLVAAGGARDLVVMPNPFYQIYEGAALLAGARPWFLDCPAERDFRPDFDAVPADANSSIIGPRAGWSSASTCTRRLSGPVGTSMPKRSQGNSGFTERASSANRSARRR